MLRTLPLALVSTLAACGDPGADDPAADSTGAASTSAGPTTVVATADTSEGADTTAPGTTTGTPVDDCESSPDAIADCVESERYAADLEFIADIRVPGNAHWQAVQDLCFDRLTEWGYDVELQEYDSGINVVGRRTGATAPDEVVVIGAHYDHIEDCLGADDNATGVAAALEIGRVLATPAFDRTVMIACWDEEERGLFGSAAFAAQAAEAGTDIVVNVNFDMIGYVSDEPGTQQIPPGLDLAFPDAYAEIQANEFRGDFIVMMADAGAATAAADFIAQADRIGLRTGLLALPAGTETSDLFTDLRRSDHASFWDNGFPALFLSDSANFRNTHYHCQGGPDTIADLDEGFAVAVARATAGAAASAAGL